MKLGIFKRYMRGLFKFKKNLYRKSLMCKTLKMIENNTY